MSEKINFADEIETNRNSVEVPAQTAGIETAYSALDVRLRGGYITDCELTSPSTGARVGILYAEPDLTKPKLTASHVMMPAGPYDGIGGQHGFPRWADYDAFPQTDGQDGERRLTVQAKRSDTGLSLEKSYQLSATSIEMQTTLSNPQDAAEATSIGEHLYFPLQDERLDGLTINGQSLDELLGEGSEETIKSAGTLYWAFGGEAEIAFPAGHSILIRSEFQGSTEYPPVVWIWKRPDSPSICFEPVVGVEYLADDDRSGVKLLPHASATLTTSIELL